MRDKGPVCQERRDISVSAKTRYDSLAASLLSWMFFVSISCASCFLTCNNCASSPGLKHVSKILRENAIRWIPGIILQTLVQLSAKTAAVANDVGTVEPDMSVRSRVLQVNQFKLDAGYPESPK